MKGTNLLKIEFIQRRLAFPQEVEDIKVNIEIEDLFSIQNVTSISNNEEDWK